MNQNQIINEIEKLKMVKPIHCKICNTLTINFYSELCNDCYNLGD